MAGWEHGRGEYAEHSEWDGEGQCCPRHAPVRMSRAAVTPMTNSGNRAIGAFRGTDREREQPPGRREAEQRLCDRRDDRCDGNDRQRACRHAAEHEGQQWEHYVERGFADKGPAHWFAGLHQSGRHALTRNAFATIDPRDGLTICGSTAPRRARRERGLSVQRRDSSGTVPQNRLRLISSRWDHASTNPDRMKNSETPVSPPATTCVRTSCGPPGEVPHVSKVVGPHGRGRRTTAGRSATAERVR